MLNIVYIANRPVYWHVINIINNAKSNESLSIQNVSTCQWIVNAITFNIKQTGTMPVNIFKLNGKLDIINLAMQ